MPSRLAPRRPARQDRQRKHRTRHSRRRRRLRVEPLEDRRLLAVFHPAADAADGEPGSLRAAITAANSNGEDDIINLAAGTYSLSLPGGGDDLNASGDLDVTEAGTELVLRGQGAHVTTIDAAGIDRVLHVLAGAAAVVEGVTVTGGAPAGFTPGGGLANYGTLVLRSSRVTGNRFSNVASGGAVFNPNGELTVDRSTIDANDEVHDCVNWCFAFTGAISNSGHAQVINSTISAPTTTGIENFLGTVDVLNSTIVQLTGANVSGEVRLRNSILSRPMVPITDAGNNLMGGDPKLGPLGLYGGTTPTFALLEDSPAIDAGDNTGAPGVDQRGQDRPQDGDQDGRAVVDIGAFEYQDARPNATDDTYTIGEDNVLRVAAEGVLSNDSHPGGVPLTAQLAEGPREGTLQLNADGSFEYVPPADFHGTDQFTYRAGDGSLSSGTATVTINVTPENDAPVAGADNYFVAPGDSLAVAEPGLLANDTDVDGDPLSAILVNGPEHGTIVLQPHGGFEYTPDGGFTGTDQFTYRADDGELESDAVAVTIRVETITVTTTADEDDGFLGGGDGISLREAVRYAPHGAVVDLPSGEYQLTRRGSREDAGATGDLDLRRDLTLRGAGAETTVIDAAPLAEEISTGILAGDRAIHVAPGVVASIHGVTITGGRPDVSTLELNAGGAVLNEGQLAISSAALLDNQTVGFPQIETRDGRVGTQLSGGAIHNTGVLAVADSTIRGNRVLARYRSCFTIFTPSCSLFETIGGEGGGIWNAGQLILTGTVLEENHADNGGGIANNASLLARDIDLSRNTAVVFGGAVHSISLATDHLTRATVSGNSALYGGGINTHGTITIADSTFRDNRAVPDEGLSDGGGLLIQGGGSGLVTGSTFSGNRADLGGAIHVYSSGALHVINSTISGNSASERGGGIINRFAGDLQLTHVTLSDNSADEGGGFYAELQPVRLANSIVAGNRGVSGGHDVDGAVQAEFSLVENVEYAFFLDASEHIESPAAGNNVTGVNPRLGPLQDNGGRTQTHALLSGSPAVDTGSNALAVDAESQPLASDQRGQARIVDAGGGAVADLGAVEVQQTLPPPVNRPPAVLDDSYSTMAGSTLDVPAAGVLENDTDADSDRLTAVLDGGPSHGQLILRPDGSFSYEPDPEFHGVDSFTYTADDGALRSEAATVSVTVIKPNAPPVAVDDAYNTTEDAVLTVAAPGVLDNDLDEDGDPLVAFPVSGPEHGTLTWDLDGSFVYVPDAGFSGVDGFDYIADDGEAISNLATVTITIAAVNQSPSAVDDTYQLDQGDSLSVAAPGVVANDSDRDGDTLTAVLVDGPSNGSLVLDAEGAFRYTPDDGFFGSDQFTYVAGDDTSSSNVATVSIEVTEAVPLAATKFAIVDSAADEVFAYDAAGGLVARHALNQANRSPRGAAASPDGSRRWVIDNNDHVYAYDPDGVLVGQWKAEGLSRPEGIASDGQDIWIVDRGTDRVYRFRGAAGRLEGSQHADGSFALARGNRNPKGITTDGSRLWIVNSARQRDRVFQYSTSGMLSGSWDIDPRNARPTGITIDPAEVNHLWIVDAGSDQVFAYHDGAARRSGSHSADALFDLVGDNTAPQGIADPPADPVPPAVSERPVSPWHNPLNWLDVNDDGRVAPLDVLLIVNQLNRHLAPTQNQGADPAHYLDVNNDGEVTPADALQVINHLNAISVPEPEVLADHIFAEPQDWSDDDEDDEWLDFIARGSRRA